ncbi:MAG: response regulator [Bacteroidales bacterium]|nr:response regulator [Bacteroidales bacterium]
MITSTLLLTLFVGYRSSHSLLQSIQLLSQPDPNLSYLQQGITSLYKADNNFRLFIVTSDKSFLQAYTKDLNYINKVIDSLRVEGKKQYSSTISSSILNKQKLSSKYLELKAVTDSLLALTLTFDDGSFSTFQLPEYGIKRYSYIRNSFSSDTLLEMQSKNEKKGFFKKVKSLFKDDSTEGTSKTVISKSESQSDSTTEQTVSAGEYKLLKDIHSFYLKNLMLYSSGNKRLNEREAELVAINSGLISSLEQLLTATREEQNLNTELIMKQASEEAHQSFSRLVGVAAVIFLLAIILFFIILNNLNRITEFSKGLERSRMRAERLAEQKSFFLTSMSHEIRAPLNNIIGFTEQLSSEKLSEEQALSLEGISTSSDMLLDTVNQILDFSTLESGKMRFTTRNFNPSKVIDEVISANTLRARKKRIVIKKHFNNSGILEIIGDEFRLKQTISNLVDNAIKYSDHGEITISGSLDSKKEKNCLLKLEVSDQGIGIPNDQLENVFIEFTRIDDKGLRPWQSGTGLGLPICKRIIEQQNGTIEVKSQVGKGTIFSLKFPYSQISQSDDAVLKVETVENWETLAGKHILMAEDDEFSRLLVEKICMKQNIILTTASDGIIAFKLFNEGNFDLVLTDINMPGMNGFEFVTKVRQIKDIAKSTLPVYAVTANVMEEELKQIVQSGMDGYILKPFREKELLKTILNAFQNVKK